ncbi:response regulator [Vallicoccus soli]|uniref:Response regulator n=1 Tax=Vallicoccus soli TaxID=2339232 RepID=A0A3A3Z3Y6_9ACTN|nr:response regulator [Vallicoccus soli]RJK98132.1 response regulator [Vallicoccus soli]
MRSPLGRVLVVDDTESIRELISVNLELEGFEVERAVDGQDALDRLAAAEVLPDVVTLDVVMPRLDGIAAAAALRSDPRTAGLRIAMVTASVQELDASRVARVDAFLPKPFDPSELVALVRRLAGVPGA